MAEGAGFFSRLSNLWKGFVSLWISDLEREHPEIAYENAINSMIEKYSKLKKATAAIIRRREEVSERLAVQTKDGRPLVWGFWDSANPIAVRVLDGGRIDDGPALVRGRLEAAKPRRRRKARKRQGQE